CARALGPFDYW
nr:immunoglobulin heavy chain junction region [Mus musculus]